MDIGGFFLDFSFFKMLGNESLLSRSHDARV